MLHKGPQRLIQPIFPPPLMVKSVGSCPAADSAIPLALHWHYHHIPEALYTREQIIYGALCQVLLALISPSRACPVTAYIAECRCKLFWGSRSIIHKCLVKRIGTNHDISLFLGEFLALPLCCLFWESQSSPFPIQPNYNNTSCLQ